MSKGVNSCFFIGRLGKDVDVRYAQSGTAVGNFSLAVGGRKKVGGEWQDHTEWVDCVVFGKTAEACRDHLSKGSQCAVQGELQTRKWQDKEGNDRYTTEIVAREVTFLGGNQGGFDPNG
jgi:single-strand DNA-binding protein